MSNRKLNYLALCSAILAFLIFLLPIYADFSIMLISKNMYIKFTILSILSYLLVIIPALISRKQIINNKKLMRGNAYVWFAILVPTINVLGHVIVIITKYIKDTV